jgi:two-component system cell cycle response regulator DivK
LSLYPSSPSLPPPLVLIVDDDADTREMYGMWLAFSGLRIVGATSATDAVGKAQTMTPDVVTTDIGLPGIDGCELCERLRNDSRTKSIPVIMVTGWTSNEQLDRARRAGCDSVLPKPCLPEVLLEEIERLLGIQPTNDSGDNQDRAWRALDETRRQP